MSFCLVFKHYPSILACCCLQSFNKTGSESLLKGCKSITAFDLYNPLSHQNTQNIANSLNPIIASEYLDLELVKQNKELTGHIDQ